MMCLGDRLPAQEQGHLPLLPQAPRGSRGAGAGDDHPGRAGGGGGASLAPQQPRAPGMARAPTPARESSGALSEEGLQVVKKRAQQEEGPDPKRVRHVEPANRDCAFM